MNKINGSVLGSGFGGEPWMNINEPEPTKKKLKINKSRLDIFKHKCH